jgi:hypothetical protein
MHLAEPTDRSETVVAFALDTWTVLCTPLISALEKTATTQDKKRRAEYIALGEDVCDILVAYIWYT